MTEPDLSLTAFNDWQRDPEAANEERREQLSLEERLAGIMHCRCAECGAEWDGPVGQQEGLTRCNCGSTAIEETETK